MSVQEAFANMFSRIADHFLDMAARMMATELSLGFLKLFGFGSSLGGDLGLGANDLAGGLDGFAANGGPVKGGGSYIVGEKGPELFVPGSSGNIVPNHELGGSGTNIVVNVDASGSSVEGDEGQAAELGRMLGAAIQAELIREKRPGGLLAGTR